MTTPIVERDDDEDEHRHQEHLERHLEARRPAHEEPHDRREEHQHDEVVHRHLHERVGGVAVGEVAPDEHHRRAGGRGQDDDPGRVLVGQLRPDERQEQVLEEQPAQEAPC